MKLKIKVNGLNTSKIINNLIEENVALEKININSKCTTFEIDEKNLFFIKKVCKRFHKKYEIIERNGLKNVVKHLRFYFGFILSMLICASLFLSFNQYIYKVNLVVGGEEKYNIDQVRDYLALNNIGAGAKRKDIVVSEVQNMILENFSDVSGCTVKKEGGTLDVIIYPAIIKEQLTKLDIVSKYNAVVSKVEIYVGETNLKEGDIVRVGDTLIKNNNGASGKIIGKVYFSDYLIYNEIQPKKVFTGKSLTETNISIFNKKLLKQRKIEENQSYLEENCVFCLSQNLFFPINIIKTQYREFFYENQVIGFDLVENELKEKIYSQVLCNVQDTSTITNVTYSVIRENNLVRLDCFVECEIDLTK